MRSWARLRKSSAGPLVLALGSFRRLIGGKRYSPRFLSCCEALARSISSGFTMRTLPEPAGSSGLTGVRGLVVAALSSSASSSESSSSASSSGFSSFSGVMVTFSGWIVAGPLAATSSRGAGSMSASSSRGRSSIFTMGRAAAEGIAVTSAPAISCCLRRSSAACCCLRWRSIASRAAAALRSAFQAPTPSRISVIQALRVAFGSSANAPSRQKP